MSQNFKLFVMSLSFKAEKKSKISENLKKREDDLQREKNRALYICDDTRFYDVIRRNFEKSSSREINL